jgi:hypothetical protein
MERKKERKEEAHRVVKLDVGVLDEAELVRELYVFYQQRTRRRYVCEMGRGTYTLTVSPGLAIAGCSALVARHD